MKKQNTFHKTPTTNYVDSLMKQKKQNLNVYVVFLSVSVLIVIRLCNVYLLNCSSVM